VKATTLSKHRHTQHGECHYSECRNPKCRGAIAYTVVSILHEFKKVFSLSLSVSFFFSKTQKKDLVLTGVAHGVVQARRVHRAHRDAQAVDAVRGFEVGHHVHAARGPFPDPSRPEIN